MHRSQIKGFSWSSGDDVPDAPVLGCEAHWVATSAWPSENREIRCLVRVHQDQLLLSVQTGLYWCGL